jgi:putative transposase
MKRHGRPETIATDRLRSFGAALKDLGRGDDREMGRWLNNRTGNSQLPFRRRERAMLRFRRMHTLQKFASVQASVHNHFPMERHLQDRNTYKRTRAAALAEWCGLLAARLIAVSG